MCTKGSGKLPFSECLGFQSNGLEFSKCRILARTCTTIWCKKKRVEKQNSEKGFEKNEHACIVEGVLGFRIFLPVWNLKAAGPTRKFQSSSKLRQFRKRRAEIPDTPLGLTGIGKSRWRRVQATSSQVCWMLPRSCSSYSRRLQVCDTLC